MRTPALDSAFALAASAALASGCGPDCQSSCQKLYAENECDIPVPGASREQLLRECSTVCEDALNNPGDIRDGYEPTEYTPSDKSLTIETDQEAALWMDCVDEMACELLEEGYCSGLGF